MNVMSLCSFALAFWTQGYEGGYESRIESMQSVCERVAITAESRGMDSYIAMAMAWEESRFRDDLTSSEGAVGPMQVIPRFTCPDRKKEGCDLVDAGVSTYQMLLEVHKRRAEALCHYNSGNRCNSHSRAYASRVIKRADKLKRIVEVCNYTCGC